MNINSIDDSQNDDSMDPTDPNSIMYDPSIANANVSIEMVNGQAVIIAPVDTEKEDSYSDPSSVNSNAVAPDSSFVPDDDTSKKLRRFGRANS